MPIRLMRILCILTVVLAVTATIFGLINAGGFDWKALAKGATLITIALVAWSSAKQKPQKRAEESKPASPPQQP